MLDGSPTPTTAFTTMQTADLEKALARAQQDSGCVFSVYVGPLDLGRASALAIHRGLAMPTFSVLIAVDPDQRLIEVITGEGAKEHLDDQSCRLACLTMASRFAIGDIAAGLRDGVNLLADHARPLPVLHTDLPENA